MSDNQPMQPESGAPIAVRIGDLVLDGTALTGAGLITYGAHLIYHPAAFIVGGLFCLGGAWMAARKSA